MGHEMVTASSKEQSWRIWLQLALGMGLTFLFFYMMAPFLVPFLLGAVCAILSYPAYELFKRHMPRHLSAFLTTLAITLGILIPVILMIYSSVYRVLNMLKRLRILHEGQSVESLVELPFIRQLIAGISRWIPIDREWMQAQALDFLQLVVEKLTGIIGNFLTSMPSLLIGISIVVLSTYFFLTDGAKFLRFLVSLSPLKLERSVELYGTFERSCRGVVLGLFMSGVVQGVLMSILFLITGLPDAVFIFFVTIIAGMIPLVGSAPIWIGAVVYHAVQNNFGFALVMLIGGILVSTSDNIVRPVVMKGQAEMHPLLALVSVFGAINLFGPTGIFLGPVIAAVFLSFLKILSLELRRENIATAQPAPPAPPT